VRRWTSSRTWPAALTAVPGEEADTLSTTAAIRRVLWRGGQRASDQNW
jgi:hypothetical protein